MFDQALNSIKEYSRQHQVKSLSDAKQAINHFGIPTDFFSVIGGLGQNPIVSQAARICGVDTGKIEEDIKRLSGKSSSTLDKYKRELNLMEKQNGRIRND